MKRRGVPAFSFVPVYHAVHDDPICKGNPMAITLSDLVANRTMSSGMAATLAAAVDERRSFLIAAIPRMAGKTTIMQAMLACRAETVALHQLSEASGLSLGIPAGADGGYLVLSEIAQAPFADYLWGAPVRQAFRAAREQDFGLAAALHAGSVEEAFEIVAHGNRVPDEDAARLELLIYIRTLGRNWQRPDRRVVAAVYAIAGVQDGVPTAQLLHHWDESNDRFITGDVSRVAFRGYGRRLTEFTAQA